MTGKQAIIIGAGPAGLTAAYELLKRTDIKPIILELSDSVGGISRTIQYRGNRMDIGGHRFFSKSNRVMNWWTEILPIQDPKNGRDPEKTDQVMLIRSRVSRIFFLRKFFSYPITLSLETVKNLGLIRMIRIGLSYLRVQVFKIVPEKSLEDFFINRFGRELYGTFFKDYTEKVWGVPCSQIKPEWGAQRIKGLSITKSLIHALKKVFLSAENLQQKKTETSLIEQFLYPKFGPGQLWEEVARQITRMGGEIRMGTRVTQIESDGNRVSAAVARTTQGTQRFVADYFFSTMPVQEMISGLQGDVPEEVREVARGLCYRDFITVGVLLKKLKIKNNTNIPTRHDLIPDHWIYIQERDVKVGRLQIFNNWSPYMVHDPDQTWIGMEYFCNEGDALWSKTDPDFISFSVEELIALGFIDREDFLDACVARVPKTYPAYFGSYDRFECIKNFTLKFSNLFLIGRNGMHRYNNMDHSMLTAMIAVDNIASGIVDHSNLWQVNAEEEYHERKTEE